VVPTPLLHSTMLLTDELFGPHLSSGNERNRLPASLDQTIQTNLSESSPSSPRTLTMHMGLEKKVVLVTGIYRHPTPRFLPRVPGNRLTTAPQAAPKASAAVSSEPS
jgi:hypothetical protein